MTEQNTGGGAPTSVGDSLIGKEIDGCAIVKKIGQGGMGIVYLAEHTKLRQQYVVKILNPALVAAEDTVQRFFREAQSVARLNHPAIVSIQNVGQEGDYYYIRMEYVDGDTVENIIKQEKKLDWKLATRIVLDTADALSHAHKKGIIHRDIKPENIMFTTAGQVKVMDFGLAKQVQAATKVSVTGQIVGTPFFMSPEQAGGKTTDARSDIYSLGVTYYYLLTGVKPFNGKNLQEIFLKHFFYTPESPKIFAPDLPESVCEIIRRCLKKKKKERYQSAAELARDLRVAIGEEAGTISAGDAPGFTDEEDANAARINGGIASSGSEPGAGDSDVSAARAEISADDDSKTVNVGSRTRPSIDPSDAPPPSSGDGDEPAAPIQRRGGRPSIEQIASASVVFNRGGPLPTSLPGADGEEVAPVVQRRDRVSLDQVAGASVVFSPKKPATEQATVATGTATMADPANGTGLKLGHRRESSAIAKPPKRSPLKAVGLALVGLALVGGTVFGGYETVGRSKCGILEKRYSDLAKTTPGDKDATAWGKRSSDFQQLALDFDDYTQGLFCYSSGASVAADLALKCRDAGRNAQTRKTMIVAGNTTINEEKYREKVAAALAAVQKAAKEIGDDEAKHDFVAAGQLASETWELYTKTNPEGRDPCKTLIHIPVEVVVNPPGSKLVRPENNSVVVGEAPANGSPLLLHVTPYSELKFIVKHTKFKNSLPWSDTINGYKKIPIELERDSKPPIDLGVCGPYRFGRQANKIEPVLCESLFTVDRQAGALVFITRQGELRAVGNKDGRPLWNGPVIREKVDIGEYGDPSGGPEVLPGRAIFTAGCDGVVRALDINTGVTVWNQGLNSPVTSHPRLTPDGFGLVVGTVNGDIVMFDTQGNQSANGGAGTGKITWTVNADAAIDTGPAIRGDVVYAASRDGRLRALDVKTGAPVGNYDAQDAICAGPMVAGDAVYIGTRLGGVHALTSDLSRVLFTTKPGGGAIVDLTVAGDTLYYATANELHAVNATTGAQAFPAFQPGNPIVGLAPMRGHIGIVTTTGLVIALDNAGNVDWTFAVKDPKGAFLTVGAPPVVVGDDLYVATREGFLVIVAAD